MVKLFSNACPDNAGKSHSLRCLLERFPHFFPLKSDILKLKPRAESISKQLRSWSDSLQNSEIKGQRYLTEKTRRIDAATRDREAFLQELRQAQEERLNKLQKNQEPPDTA
jgi:hypothetical protein